MPQALDERAGCVLDVGVACGSRVHVCVTVRGRGRRSCRYSAIVALRA